MRVYAGIIAALLGLIGLGAACAGEPIVPSEPVVRGSISSNLSSGFKCLSASATEILPGTRLEMRRCENSADQLFEWNVLSFEIKVHNLCVDALRSGDADSQPGDPVGLWYCQGTKHQKWYPFRDSPQALALSFVGGGNPNGNLCLDNSNGSTEDGAHLVISHCSRGDSQRFQIRLWRAPLNQVLSGRIAPSPALWWPESIFRRSGNLLP